jgi:acetyl-CoA carboxylase biotin carboxylase subunit
MRRALGEYVVSGIRTNLPFHERLFEHPEFMAGDYDTGFIERNADALLRGTLVPPEARQLFAAAVALASFRNKQPPGSLATKNGDSHAVSPWVHAHRARLLSGRS